MHVLRRDVSGLRRFLAVFAVSLLFLLASHVFSNAAAQSYPDKPIKIIVPFAPGGTTDIIARVMSEPLSKILGQNVVVENKAGAGGAVGAKEIAKAKPDGYVLGIATVSTTASNPAINPSIGYDPIQDFTYISNIAATPNVIAVHPSFPARDYKGFVAELKRNPTKYSYASSGVGGIGHLQTELFKSLAKVFMVHIPYRGAGPALNDVIGGQLLIIFDNLPSALPHIKAGKLIPIVVAAPSRLAQLPSVPTFKEVGLEPVNRMAYYGLQAPSNLAPAVKTKLQNAVQTALKDPMIRKRIEDTGSIVLGNTAEQFTSQVKSELDVYKRVVADKGLSLK